MRGLTRLLHIIVTVLVLVVHSTVSTAATPSFPVILIHGWNGGPVTTWGALSTNLVNNHLWTEGGTVTASSTNVRAAHFYEMQFSDNDNTTLTFDQQAVELSKVVKAVLDANHATKVILVGHSMGGLAARQYLEFHYHDVVATNNVAAVITIGTPHQGAAETALLAVVSGVDCFVGGVNCLVLEDLKVGSTALGLLNSPAAVAKLPRDISYTSLIGSRLLASGDGIVTAESQNLANILGTGDLRHTAVEVTISPSFLCFASSQVHTCETQDSRVEAQIVSAINSLAQGIIVFADNVETGPSGWFAESRWGITTATSHSATHSWTDSPSGNYANNSNKSLWSPFLDFSSVNSAKLTFWHRYDLENNFDFGNVWVTTNNGVTFTQVASFTGTNTTWTQATINLNAFAGQPSVRIVFQLTSDSSVTRDGWYIDDVTVTETLPGGNTAPVDVFLIVDLSGSFIDDLSNFKTQAADMIATLRAANSNIRFGLAKFEDYPISPFGISGDKAYQRLVDLTFDTNLLLSTIAGLSISSGGSGGDGPQSQLPALFQAATGAGQTVPGFSAANIPAGQQANFRDGAAKLFVLWTDAAFHQRGDPGTIPYPGPTFAETVAAIRALDPPKVIGISSGGGGVADLQRMARETGSIAPTGGVDCNGDGVIDISAGAPLVCSISSTGAAIGAAVVALVNAGATPSVAINDVVVTEGNTGTTNAVFTVSLAPASTETVTVSFSTANGSATPGNDYVAQSGMLTFSPGQISKTITVVVNGDSVFEPNETFFVNLTSATKAVIGDDQGMGTIVNDDPVPSISINDVSVTEGNSGTTNAVFTVTLSAASSQTVTVSFSTSNGTATAGSDYVTTSGTLTFTPGQTSKTITVLVNGDGVFEPNETFFANLTNPINAVIGDSQGMGTIVDNDASPGNISTRASVLTGDNVMIGGFIIEGSGPLRVLVRSRGPSMSGQPFPFNVWDTGKSVAQTFFRTDGDSSQ